MAEIGFKTVKSLFTQRFRVALKTEIVAVTVQLKMGNNT